MWNLCLPLLQKDFRKAIKAPLNLVAEALEDIDRFALKDESKFKKLCKEFICILKLDYSDVAGFLFLVFYSFWLLP